LSYVVYSISGYYANLKFYSGSGIGTIGNRVRGSGYLKQQQYNVLYKKGQQTYRPGPGYLQLQQIKIKIKSINKKFELIIKTYIILYMTTIYME